MSSIKELISIVIPVFNEAECISDLHMEIVEVCNQEKFRFEIIIVDDGSTDGSALIIKKLVPVIYIGLRRNFGQTAAFDCGIKQAKGDFIITMDGDGQNDPADIPRFAAPIIQIGAS